MTEDVGGEIGALLRYERALAAQPLVEALLDRRGGDHPPEVCHAADRILRAHAPWAVDLNRSASMLIQCAGDERSVRLFRCWALERGRSFEEMARQEELSSQRVGQIVHRAAARVRDAAAGAPLWPWLVSRARQGLGALTTKECLDVVLQRLGFTTSPAADLLAWLAGPYHPVPQRPGWVALDPRTVVRRTVDCLANDGGVRRLADVQAELEDLEITPDQLPVWLAGNGAAAVHDLAVVVTGPLGDAVERILDAHGTARTAAQLETELAAGGRVVDPGALGRAVRGRRFVRSAQGAISLAAWGAQRRPSTKKTPRRSRAKKEAPPAKARLWLWVRVDDDVLRGAEAAVPAALVEGLGLAPPTRKTFSSRCGPVTLAHDGPQPTRGSVRAVALAAGARPDDTLLLGFSVDGDVTVEVRGGAGQVGPAEVDGAPLALFPELESLNGGAP